MATLHLTAPARANNSHAPVPDKPDLATMDVDAIVHRIADINAALALLDFSRRNRARLAALADERADLRWGLQRRVATLMAKSACDTRNKSGQEGA